jgi:formate hydrogenlyase subunit 6/NADH:ubiquinone oxidoreductase subunit I
VLKENEKGLMIDYGQCIQCFCCQEICPEGAIKIKPGWAMKLAGRR